MGNPKLSIINYQSKSARKFFGNWKLKFGYSVKAEPGFTLIELMVAVSIFAIVMVIGAGALLSLVQANERAQAINSVINNLNAAIEDMTRAIRVGTTYHCEPASDPVPSAASLASPLDCYQNGGTLLAFEPSTGNPNDPNDQTVYRLEGTQIQRSLCSGVNQTCDNGTKNGAWMAMTAPEVTITRLRFYVVGSTRGDAIQPRVLMSIQGTAQVPGGTVSFFVQSGVVQRLLDI